MNDTTKHGMKKPVKSRWHIYAMIFFGTVFADMITLKYLAPRPEPGTSIDMGPYILPLAAIHSIWGIVSVLIAREFKERIVGWLSFAFAIWFVHSAFYPLFHNR